MTRQALGTLEDRNYRRVSLAMVSAIPVVQLATLLLASADYDICFGIEGGWRKSGYISGAHIATAFQHVLTWETLIVSAMFLAAVLPAILYVKFARTAFPRLLAVSATTYLALSTMSFMDVASWHDCDRKDLDMAIFLPPMLSLITTIGFLSVAVGLSALVKPTALENPD